MSENYINITIQAYAFMLVAFCFVAIASYKRLLPDLFAIKMIEWCIKLFSIGLTFYGTSFRDTWAFFLIGFVMFTCLNFNFKTLKKYICFYL